MEKREHAWKSIGIKNLDVDAIRVDQVNYQRKITPNLRKIVDSFDERKLGTIHVSKRADGTMWAIDGQHRLEACRALGRKHIRCEVYEGATIEDEAAIFDGLNNTKTVNPFYKFRARVRAGSADETTIERIFANRGHSIMGERFRAPMCAEWIYRGCGGLTDRGPAVLEWAVDVYLKAWPAPRAANESRSWIDGPLLKGIAVVGAYHRGLTVNEIARKLAEVTPESIKAQAVSMGTGTIVNRIAFAVVNRFNHKRTAKSLLPQWVITTRPVKPNGAAEARP